jgi:hypothetical protein
MTLYTVVRHKTGETLVITDDFANANQVLYEFLDAKEKRVEDVRSSDSEGWQQVECTDGELFTMQILELNRPYEEFL